MMTPVEAPATDDSTGATILLLHGAGTNREMWRPQIERFSDQYNVITPDLPGHGERSGESFSFERAVTVAANAGEITTPLFVIGISLGGYVGVAFADAHPRTVDGLVLSGASVDYSGWAGIVSWPQFVLYDLLGRFERTETLLQRRRMSNSEESSIPTEYTRYIREAGVSVRAYGQAGRALCFRDFRTPLRSFQGPVLIANGEHDRPNRYFESDLVEILRDGEIKVIENAGHIANIERPDAFNDAVGEFLSTHIE